MQLEQPLAGYNGKPEIDDGHTKIANELLDIIISTDFTKRQYKILLFIIRKTYGWNKPDDDIARSLISDATGLKNSHITTTIQELLSMNVLIISNGKSAKNYRLNKYYDTWRITETVIVTKTVIVPKLVIVTETVTESSQNGNNPLPKQYPQKTITKDNKDNSDKKTELPKQELVSDDIWNEFMAIRKKAKAQNTPLAIKSLINSLQGFKDQGYDPDKIVMKSITNSWKDVYPPKEPPPIKKSGNSDFDNFAVNKLLGRS
jgi:phage replication O-like protein O